MKPNAQFFIGLKKKTGKQNKRGVLPDLFEPRGTGPPEWTWLFQFSGANLWNSDNKNKTQFSNEPL